MPSVLTDEEVQVGDPYEALGVTPTASEQEIRGAYRRLSLKCHPDKVSLGRSGLRWRLVSLGNLRRWLISRRLPLRLYPIRHSESGQSQRW